MDIPTLACTGLSRDMLLLEHGAYLRKLLEALAGKPGAHPIRREIAQSLEELQGRRGDLACQPQRSWLLLLLAGRDAGAAGKALHSSQVV